MPRNRLLLGSLLCALGACVTEPSETETEVELDGKADGLESVYGTFVSDEGSGSEFRSLTLMTDMKYRGAKVVMCPIAPCDPQEVKGDFAFVTLENSTGHYVRLTSSASRIRYEVRMPDPDTLRLRRQGQLTWQILRRSATAWCGEPGDCFVQQLSIPACWGGSFSCIANVCEYSCSNPPPLCFDPVLGEDGVCRNGAGGECPSSACSSLCPPSQCGDEPEDVEIACSDGSTAGTTGRCLTNGDGTCSWEVTRCEDCRDHYYQCEDEEDTCKPCHGGVYACLPEHQDC
jgi:hypothetical protein